MKTSLLALAILAPVLTAQQFPEFVDGMKSIGQAMDALRKMESKASPQAMRAAERMGSEYEEMLGFFRQRGNTEAVKAAQAGKAATAQLASAVFAKDAERANAAFESLAGTCKTCHAAAREKLASGGYRIK